MSFITRKQVKRSLTFVFLNLHRLEGASAPSNREEVDISEAQELPEYLIGLRELNRLTQLQVVGELDKDPLTLAAIQDPDPCWIKDLNGRMLWCNPAYTKTYGITNRTYQNHKDTDVWDDPTSVDFGPNDELVKNSGHGQRFIELIDHNVKGTRLEMLVLKWLVKDEAGKPFGVAGRVMMQWPNHVQGTS